MAFAEEGSPAFFAGEFDIVQATYLDEPKVAETFRSGKPIVVAFRPTVFDRDVLALAVARAVLCITAILATRLPQWVYSGSRLPAPYVSFRQLRT